MKNTKDTINTSVESQSYSNIIGILAGFSLTAMILILGKMMETPNPIHENSEKIIIMFFLSFTGFISSAFSFAMCSRYSIVTNLQNAKHFFLSYATVTSLLLMFSGLISLIETTVAFPAITPLVSAIVFFFVATMGIAFTLSPTTISWNPIKYPKGKLKFTIDMFAYAPIMIIMGGRVTMFIYHKIPWGWVFYATAIALFVLIAIGNFRMISLEKADENYQVEYSGARMWAMIHSVLFGLLLF